VPLRVVRTALLQTRADVPTGWIFTSLDEVREITHQWSAVTTRNAITTLWVTCPSGLARALARRLNSTVQASM
jgi:hypothetical protein